MAILAGIGIVALILLLTSGHGWHAHAGPGIFGPRGYRPYGFGMPLWPVFLLIGAIVATAMGLLPLLLVGLGGFALYRWLSGGKAQIPSFASFGRQGAGGTPASAEPGYFCPSCSQPVSRDWATCPACGYRKYVAPDLIQRRCSTCGTELQKDWNACPYCSTRIDEPVTAPAPGPAQPQPKSPPSGQPQSYPGNPHGGGVVSV